MYGICSQIAMVAMTGKFILKSFMLSFCENGKSQYLQGDKPFLIIDYYRTSSGKNKSEF